MRSDFFGLMAIMLLTVCTSACVRIDIGDDEVEATIGRQLTDLVVAKEVGAVTESEFQQARRKLLYID